MHFYNILTVGQFSRKLSHFLFHTRGRILLTGLSYDLEKRYEGYKRGGTEGEGGGGGIYILTNIKSEIELKAWAANAQLWTKGEGASGKHPCMVLFWLH